MATAYRTNTPTKCAVCPKKFYCSKSQIRFRGRKHCSKDCYNKANARQFKSMRKKKDKESVPRNIPKTYPLSTYIKKLDVVYSLYIRLESADKRGFNPCYSCGTHKHYKEMDCGHYISRSHKSVRFYKKNTHPQCRWCNRFNEGNKPGYALHLMKDYGPDILYELDREKNKIKKWTPSELTDLIDHYKSLVEAMLASLE